MTDAIQTALIGLGGVLLGSGGALVAQIVGIRAQRRHQETQLRGDEILHTRERRRDRLLDAVAGALASGDPQSADFSYTTILRHVHHAQLLLDPKIPEELRLNQAISELASAVHDYYPVKHLGVDAKTAEVQRILRAQSEMVESCRRMVWTGSAGLRVAATNDR
jgi:hypothetical protein